MIDEAAHTWTDQSLEFVSKFIQGGMGVKLGIAAREFGQKAREKTFIDPGILQQAKHSGSMTNAATLDDSAGAA